MCIHQGKTSLFVRDYGTASELKLSKAESVELLKFLDDHIKMCSDKLQYSHEVCTSNFDFDHIVLVYKVHLNKLGL